MPVARANAPGGHPGLLRQQVYEQLRSAIEQGRLPAGGRPRLISCRGGARATPLFPTDERC